MGALASGDIFLFEGFHLDRRGLFRRDENGVLAPVAVGGRALDLLAVLIERHGEVLSKAEIMTAVWPSTAVEDGNLTLQISALRRILDHGRRAGGMIQTVARRGYRFAAEVTQVEATASRPAPVIQIEAAANPVPEALTRVAAATTSPAPEATPAQATTSADAAGTPSVGPQLRLSIMVLPFANLSSDPEQEYLADGITDDLTTDLSRIESSFVIARSTAFTYKGQAVDVRRVGYELGVHYVLEGSVRRSGGRLRINVQLVDAGTGGHVWAERFEIDRQDLAQAQDDIIGRLAHTLNLELVEDAGRHIRRERAVDPNAEDLLMRGWAWFYRPRTPANLREAQAAFTRALALRPRSGRARVGLATALAATILEGWSRSLADDQARVEELLAEVFARRTSHAPAHYAMAMLRRSQNRLTEARIEAERAVTFDHNHSAAWYEFGLAHLYLAEVEAAIPPIEKAIRLSPRDPFVSAMHYGLGRCHLALGHLDQAIALFDRVRAARPCFWGVRMWLAGAFGLAGDLAMARAELAEAKRLKPEIDSQARWRAFQPWIAVPQYWALRENTLNIGLRRAGFPEE